MNRNSIMPNFRTKDLRSNPKNPTFEGLKYFLIVVLAVWPMAYSSAQEITPAFNYTVSISQPASYAYEVELQTSGWAKDTVQFKMPRWMPGYYQIMDYSKQIDSIWAKDSQGLQIPLKKINGSTWEISGIKNKAFSIGYHIKTAQQFVANSYIDSQHAYIIPAASFLYVDGFIDTPVTVKINAMPGWHKIATGLENAEGKSNLFLAPNFDVLFDSPFLIGNLEELPSFYIEGIEHRFIGYNIGDFDKAAFMQKLQSVVKAGVNIIGDIPYKRYTFIAIGPGRGGIEHLNNTTVSFDGNQLNSEKGMNKMMNFLAHEYFHHYNVKRIRPIEVGPFDYEKGSKSNLLWISEGLSVYYEYLMVKRAGLASDKIFFQNFENNINNFENNPGRLHQSLVQASFNTWNDGPLGGQGKENRQSISYYEKGPLVGLLLDFSIRNATQNEKSLDDVMRFLYWEYYKNKQRGFSDAEFQQACETIAGTSLKTLFEYVYTTKEMDYNKYLNYGGLALSSKINDQQKKEFTLAKIDHPNALQLEILNSWLGK